MEKGREGMVKGEEVREKSRGEVKEEIVLPLDLNTGYGSEMKHLSETSSYQKHRFNMTAVGRMHTYATPRVVTCQQQVRSNPSPDLPKFNRLFSGPRYT